MNMLGRSAVAGTASRRVIVDLVTLISLVVTLAMADTPPGPTAAETPTDALVAAATLPGPGPLPALVPPALLKAHHGAATLDDAIDQCVTQSMAAAGTPGAAVAVALDGALILERGYGVTRRQAGAPVDADTLFRIGSITKQLTAAAVLQQVEIGTVALDDPVTDHVPELELAGWWPADRITVHHLLTHSSSYPDLIFEPAGPTGDDALGEWAAHQNEAALHAPPGNFFNYSNPNFNLAGLVVERASGLPYRRYMAEHVLAPAGMTRTTFDPAAVIADGNYSYGHVTSPGGLETVYAPDWTAAFTLEHAGYGIFLADLDEDGIPESDFEFLDRGVPERVNWLRNRGLVGSPRLTPRHARGSLLVPVPEPEPEPDERQVRSAIVTDED